MKEDALFDAGSILELVRRLKARAPPVLSQGSTLSLAFYEVGNAIWKQCHLQGRLDAGQGKGLLSTLVAIIGAMDVVTPDSEESAGRALELADRLRLTYYDASYRAEARNSGKILVTDDAQLLKAARKAGVRSLTSEAFQGSLDIEVKDF